MHDVPLSDMFKIQTLYNPLKFIFIFITGIFFGGGGLLEEVGWRGFALPLFQKKLSPLKASIILGFIWSLWHIPVKVELFTSGIPNFIGFYLLFTCSSILLSIIITFFFNKLGGSILAGIAIHGLANDSAGLAQLFTKVNSETTIYTDFWVGIIALLIAAIIILYKEGLQIGKQNKLHVPPHWITQKRLGKRIRKKLRDAQ